MGPFQPGCCIRRGRKLFIAVAIVAALALPCCLPVLAQIDGGKTEEQPLGGVHGGISAAPKDVSAIPEKGTQLKLREHYQDRSDPLATRHDGSSRQSSRRRDSHLSQATMDDYSQWLRQNPLPFQTGEGSKQPNSDQTRSGRSPLEAGERLMEQENTRLQNEYVTAQTKNNLLATQLQIKDVQVHQSAKSRKLIIAALSFVVALSVGVSLYQRRMRRQLLFISTTDSLTGLLNRRGTTQLFTKAEKSSATVFMLDVDRFKSINDHFGHAVGDSVLKEIATRMKKLSRQGDIVARWGGEEFLLCAWDMTPEEAGDFSHRLCMAIATEPFLLKEGSMLQLTVSIGFALYPLFSGNWTAQWHDTIYLADRALYAAKQSGRNCWAGLKGEDAPTDCSIQYLYDNIDIAIERGWMHSMSEKDIEWIT
jgi:diguanylate cyclase (GGDEF)-like protein